MCDLSEHSFLADLIPAMPPMPQLLVDVHGSVDGDNVLPKAPTSWTWMGSIAALQESFKKPRNTSQRGRTCFTNN